MIKLTKKLTVYEITDDDFSLSFSIEDGKITLINRAKNYPHTFEFVNSDPYIVEKFAKAMLMAVKEVR